MTSPNPPAKPSMPPPKYKRSVKNYLIDPRFQFKYTGILVGVTLLVSGALIGVLWQTSREVVAQSQAVEAQGRKAVEESRKVSEVVRMSMKDDYSSNPELLEAFNASTKEADKTFDDQARALAAQQAGIAKQQSSMLTMLIAGLALMVLVTGLLGIYVTHKIAGPIYKMKMLLRGVEQGKLSFQGRLRKGDELQDFFEAFAAMVEALRSRQATEVKNLEQALQMARESGASGESIRKIELVHDEMKKALDM
jgi:nitrogen fixation/metabolism regulation signal transduction histidine kinase